MTTTTTMMMIKNRMFDRSSGLLLGTDSLNVINISTILNPTDCFPLAL